MIPLSLFSCSSMMFSFFSLIEDYITQKDFYQTQATGIGSAAVMMMMSPPQAIMFCSIGLLLLLPSSLLAFQQKPSIAIKNNINRKNYPDELRNNNMHFMSTMAEVATKIGGGAAPTIISTLKKPSKVLTVGVEYSTGGNDDDDDDNNLSMNELAILSMQLRKSKVSSIWCSNPTHAEEFTKEQATALGNFPGPCPVIYFGPLPEEGGVKASAIVVSASEAIGDNMEDSSMEIIWKVSSVEDVESILEKTGNNADAFWIQQQHNDAEEDTNNVVEEIVKSIPKGALCIASLDAMQPDGAEVQQAKELKKIGVGSIMISNACVGDTEDLEYTNFVVGGMTSKASSEFSFSGLTGSTNGHFGGVQARGSVKWQRT